MLYFCESDAEYYSCDQKEFPIVLIKILKDPERFFTLKYGGNK